MANGEEKRDGEENLRMEAGTKWHSQVVLLAGQGSLATTCLVMISVGWLSGGANC